MSEVKPGLKTGRGRVIAMVGSRAMETTVPRDGTRGRLATVAPRIWAVRASNGRVRRFARCGAGAAAVRAVECGSAEKALGPMLLAAAEPVGSAVGSEGEAARPSGCLKVPKVREAHGVEVAFYRKYTEGMLRRYGVLSMEGGRVPSLLGREMFRGRVTSYRVKSFEDVVIFCHDVESCLKRLSETEQQLVKRIALQEYTHMEAAVMLGLSLRSCVRQYAEAVDRLTVIFLKERMLEPLRATGQ